MRITFALPAALLFLSAASSAPPEKVASAPPSNAALKAEVKAAAELTWSGDLASALKLAADKKLPVFIDFTGVTCTNCKINEKNVFSRPEVRELLGKYMRVQLYADTIPADFYKEDPGEEKRDKDAEVNLEFMRKQFDKEQLPLYVIVRPAEKNSFTTVGVYDEGRINKVDAFIAFLKKPLSDSKE
jgi:thiol:disulfide interchange protein DsbD